MSNHEDDKISVEDLRCVRSDRQLEHSSFLGVDDVPGERDDRVCLRVELSVDGRDESEQSVKVRLQSSDRLATLRALEGLHAIGDGSVDTSVPLSMSLHECLDRILELFGSGHDSSPSVGGCGDPQPTEGEARKGGDAA